MRKKNYKGRCLKRTIPKCTDICRTYDDIQAVFAEMLSSDDNIQEFACNVLMDPPGEYTSDFVCTRNDGTKMVRECVWRKHLYKPMTAQLLEESRQYWRRHGILNWGIVTNEEE